eukprot:11074696-Heterocapsa_arctica.AAC.1
MLGPRSFSSGDSHTVPASANTFVKQLDDWAGSEETQNAVEASVRARNVDMAWNLACKGLRKLVLPLFQRRHNSIPYDHRDACRRLQNRILQMREQSLHD